MHTIVWYSQLTATVNLPMLQIKSRAIPAHHRNTLHGRVAGLICKLAVWKLISLCGLLHWSFFTHSDIFHPFRKQLQATECIHSSENHKQPTKSGDDCKILKQTCSRLLKHLLVGRHGRDGGDDTLKIISLPHSEVLSRDHWAGQERVLETVLSCLWMSSGNSATMSLG